MPFLVLAGSSLCNGPAEQFLKPSGLYHGSTTHRLPAPLVTLLTAKSQRLADAFQFKGFWGVDFLLQDGVPFLVDLNSGRMNGCHSPKLFLELHAPGQPFRYWRDEIPPDGPTAAVLSHRLQALGLEFTAGAGHGIALLMVLPGLKGTSGRFIAVGRDSSDLHRIFDTRQAHSEGLLAPM